MATLWRWPPESWSGRCSMRSASATRTRANLAASLRENLEELLRTAREEAGAPLPRFVERAFRAYLACGIPSAGFTRLVCQRCGHQAILAFSCKTRHLCPSCTGRHMEDGTAHLLDYVLPGALPYRQVVVSLPFEVRGLLAFRPNLLNTVFRLVNDAALRWLERRGQPSLGGRAAGVAVLQRAGGALNIHPHFHLLLADGLFVEGPDGTVAFHPLPTPSLAEVAQLAGTVHRRLVTLLRRRGLLLRQGDPSASADEKPDALASCIQMALLPGARQHGPRAVDVAADEASPPAPSTPALCASFEGVNVHAQVTVRPHDTRALAHLVRYLLRPSFSLARLALRDDGAVLYRLRKPDKKGRSVLVLTPLELLARLAAILPAPRFALRREIGLFAPGAKLRRKVVPTPPARGACHVLRSLPSPAAQPADAPTVPPLASSPPAALPPPSRYLPPPARLPWADLIRRTFDIDSLACPRCPGRLAPIAVAQNPAEAEPLLRLWGLFSPLHPAALSRGMPP
jgi:hypothetical protein